MTVEWVTVHPDLRKRFSRIQYVDILMGLAFHQMNAGKFHSAIGFSRTDLKADRVVEKFGGKRFELTQQHDIECALMVMERVNLKRHENDRTAQMIDDLYFVKQDNNLRGSEWSLERTP